MFVKCDKLTDLPWKYTPRNDFCVWFETSKFAFPLILGEIVSDPRQGKDRFRMLLQAVALARAIFALRKAGSAQYPFIVAVYLTQNMTAERYIVMKVRSEEPDKVVHRFSINAILFIFLRFLSPRKYLILLKKMVLLPSSARCTTSHLYSNPLLIN